MSLKQMTSIPSSGIKCYHMSSEMMYWEGHNVISVAFLQKKTKPQNQKTTTKNPCITEFNQETWNQPKMRAALENNLLVHSSKVASCWETGKAEELQTKGRETQTQMQTSSPGLDPGSEKGR